MTRARRDLIVAVGITIALCIVLPLLLMLTTGRSQPA